MILLIDNYDSFSYNLYQLAGALHPDVRVVRNDAYTVEELAEMKPEALILSPGPGRPEQAGICVEAVKRLAGCVPIFGVCLGHQAICQAFGGTISYAGELMHGKQSEIRAEPDSVLFRGINGPIRVARYHSLAAVKETLPKELRVTATAEDGEVMAVEHEGLSVYGVQFHPESVMTPEGMQIMKNFMEVIRHD